MPNSVQNDIGDSYEVCQILGIKMLEINIEDAFEGIRGNLGMALHNAGSDAPYATVYKNDMIKTNLPARLRMATLYTVAALYPNSRVVNTCNRSEDYVGYSTKYGDAAGDFSPLGNLTVREVLEIGDELDLPKHLVRKAPSDGMCGKTDENNLGFTYDELDTFLLDFKLPAPDKYERIIKLHNSTRHKYNPMPTFAPVESDIIDPN
jgi:NAD+ synthase